MCRRMCFRRHPPTVYSIIIIRVIMYMHFYYTHTLYTHTHTHMYIQGVPRICACGRRVTLAGRRRHARVVVPTYRRHAHTVPKRNPSYSFTVCPFIFFVSYFFFFLFCSFIFFFSRLLLPDTDIVPLFSAVRVHRRTRVAERKTVSYRGKRGVVLVPAAGDDLRLYADFSLRPVVFSRRRRRRRTIPI